MTPPSIEEYGLLNRIDIDGAIEPGTHGHCSLPGLRIVLERTLPVLVDHLVYNLDAEAA